LPPTKNVIAGGKASVYPAGNFFPSIDAFRRAFVAFEKGDYRLAPGSDWRGAGTDGKDLGADLTQLPRLEHEGHEGHKEF
jgi:hypothetical protein